MLNSMTGFASATGSAGLFDWSLDLKTVNNKGLDIRVRVPDWLDGLEQTLRKLLTENLRRGSVQVSLRVSKSTTVSHRQLDTARVDQIMQMVGQVQRMAQVHDVACAPLSFSEIISLNGMQEAGADTAASTDLIADIMVAFPSIVQDLQAHRAAEGAALHAVLSQAVDRLEQMIHACNAQLLDRQVEFEANFQAAVARLRQAPIDPDRLSAEMAILAVKSDITEELDRLDAHISAARDLLSSGDAVGRKFDFLMQEFNREANTLCSKSGTSTLTQLGLDMKVTIDQMREQVQNVE